MKSKFYKYQALGNDYIVIEPQSDWFEPTPEQIRKICDRNYGVGSDGILYGPEWQNDQPFLRIFNPDGSEAEKSGNGLRIFAQHLFLKGHVDKRKFSIITNSGTSDVEILNSDATRIKIDMGRPSFRPEDIPINDSESCLDKEIRTSAGILKISSLSVGNPHTVFFPEKWDEDLIRKIGPELENNAFFPNRTNVQMVKVLDRNTIEIRIWERGAGYTLASGSSSCAAAYVCYTLGRTDNTIDVVMPGGKISIQIDENDHVWKTGEVEKVFEGTFSGE